MSQDHPLETKCQGTLLGALHSFRLVMLKPIDLDIMSALPLKLAELEAHRTGDPNPHVCLSDDLQYGLAGRSIYSISILDNELSMNKVFEIEQQDLFPQVQWILCYATNQLILVGSQSLGLEEAIALCGEPDPSLGHEIDLTPVPDFDQKSSGSLVTCSLCLRTQASGMSWQCPDCKPEGPLGDESFNVCMPCLQNGLWCYDKGHRLVSEASREKSIGWRATHIIQLVDLRQNHCFVRTAYERRAVSQSTNKPCIDESLGVLTWMLSDLHILTLKYATGDIEISTVTGGNEEVQVGPLPSVDQNTISTPEPPDALRDNFDTTHLANMAASSSQEEQTPAITVNGTICDVCIAMFSTSELLQNASLWDQRPLEEVLKNVDPSTKKRQKPRRAAKQTKEVEEEKYKKEQTETSVHLNSETLQHHPSLHSLACSIFDGCLLCSRLWQEMKEKKEREEIRGHLRQLVVSGSNRDDSRPVGELHDSAALVVDIHRLSSTTGKFLLYRDDASIKNADSTHNGVKFGRVSESAEAGETALSGRVAEQDQGLSKTTAYTGSGISFSVAREWLGNCQKLHNCSKPDEWVPARLVDLGQQGVAQLLRIYVTKEEDRGTQYSTLSHCWGNSNRFRLTRANFDQMSKGFAASDMPATFRHAVEISHQLGYRYIWIDSLCIIQDDSMDWSREAKTMSAVYRNSSLTIAALFSANVDSGCFSMRNISGKMPLLFQGLENTVFAIPAYREESIEASGPHNLNSRAWVFQERLLSPRTLGFSAAGITWDCKKSKYEETRPTEDEAKNMPGNVTRDKEMMDQLTTHLYRGHIRDMDRKHFLMAWFEVVYDYSGLNLTYQSDKLIALAGITQIIQINSGFNFFYGLWTDPANIEFFVAQLLWHTHEPEHGISRRQLENRPPSFSWTSCNCKVEYPTTFHDRIVNASYWGLVEKSGWVVAEGGKYFETISRHGFISISGAAVEGASPWERNIEYRSKVRAFLSPRCNAPFPMLLLEGPTKMVEIRRSPDGGKAYLWKYPWATVTEDDEKSNSTRKRWFFPDATTWESPLTLLTIARWWRSWDQRWYVAGLALGAGNMKSKMMVGGRPKVVPLMYRVGYFEHSWATKHDHWSDNGESNIVFIR